MRKVTKNMLPPIYIINLDSNPERLAKCSERLANQSVNFERVSGVLGSALTNAEIVQHYDNNLNRNKYFTPLTAGQIGCYLSHRKAWRKIAEGDAPFGIVLEDDFLLLSDLKLSISTIQALNFSWDVIKLAAYQSRGRKVKFSHQVNNKMNVAVHFKPMSGGAATAISKTAAQQLLDATNKFGRPVDTDIQHFWEKGIKVLSLLPYPVAQDMAFESTISAKKVTRKKYFWKRKRQQLYTAIVNRREVSKQVKKLKVALGV
jgi:glycosyl transferase family 25